MKKLLICIAIFVSSGVLAWLVYRKFDSAIAGYIVAAVGTAATLVPIFLPSETKPTTRIETKGNYSPGVVHGDYRVGDSGEKK